MIFVRQQADLPQTAFGRALKAYFDASDITLGNVGQVAFPLSDSGAVNDAVDGGGSYPAALAQALFDKFTMVNTLEAAGFRKLQTVRFQTLADITFAGPFIVKPALSAAGARIMGMIGPVIDVANALDFKIYLTKVGLGADIAALSAEARQAIPDANLIVQESTPSGAHVTATLCGTVNGAGDTHFLRDTVTAWGPLQPLQSVRQFDDPTLVAERALLSAFIKAQGIKNAAFALQFLRKGGLYYPMDWNLRLHLNGPIDMARMAPAELKKGMDFMFDIPNADVIDKSQVWTVNRAGLTNANYDQSTVAVSPKQ